MLRKAEGVIIKTRDYGEGNKILTIYTKEQGKISVMARGAKKPNSRLSSISQLFTYGSYLFFSNTNKGMGTLSQGEIIESFRDARQDLAQLSYAAYFAELLDRLTEEREPNEYLFHLLVDLFRFLEEKKDPEILARLFELKMLTHGGYRPELNRCVSCGRVEGTFFFSTQEGGFICHRCAEVDPYRLALSPGAFKILRLLYQIQPDRLGNINVKEKTKQELRHVLWSFMDQHTPLKLKSRDFLEKLLNH